MMATTWEASLRTARLRWERIRVPSGLAHRGLLRGVGISSRVVSRAWLGL
jgi:hypothetical protein